MYNFLKIIWIFFLGFFCLFSSTIYAKEKIKIGLLVPVTGDNKELGQQIIKSTRIALNDIGSDEIEIYLKDTNSNPDKTIKSAIELNEMEVKIVIGPVFYKNLVYLDEVENITFLSLTNKTLGLPKKCYKCGHKRNFPIKHN